MDKTRFINSIKEGSLKGQRNYGILPSLTIAQAILESGWVDNGSIMNTSAKTRFIPAIF